MTAPPGSFFDPATLEDPYPFYAWLRRESPVWQVPETGHWVVSRYADVRRVCLEPEELLACGASVRIAPGPHRHVPSVFVRRLATLEAEVA